MADIILAFAVILIGIPILSWALTGFVRELG